MSAAELIERAAAGDLPGWAEAAPARRRHAGRVAALMGTWAERSGLDRRGVVRWRAAGWLHDALRDADPDRLRTEVPAEFRELPGPLLHGPAAAGRLERDGFTDRPLLSAITYHTTGSPELGRLGRFLYLADFLEPGRTFQPVWRAALRARLPEAADRILREVVAARIAHLVETGRALRPETIAFWNALVDGH